MLYKVCNMSCAADSTIANLAEGMNARMRRIDLICKLVGPLFIALIDGGSTIAAIWVTAGLNFVSLPIEYLAIARVSLSSSRKRLVLMPDKVHTIAPKLQGPKKRSATPSLSSRMSGRIPRILKSPLIQAKGVLSSWQHYFGHPAFYPSFALALLYLTVLSFSGQMVTYLVSAGFNSFYLGLIRSLSVLFELSATWSAPRVMTRITPYRAGMWFLSWQMIWLAATISFFWSEPRTIMAASGLAAGTILSRIGLWGYDLSASLIIQTVSTSSVVSNARS